MDTKSKSFKSSVWLRVLCLLLSLLLIAGSSFFAFNLAAYFTIAGRGDALNQTPDYSETGYLGSQFDTALGCTVHLSDFYSLPGNQSIWEDNADKVVRAATEQYLDDKCDIIRSELIYAVTHVDEYEDYDEYYEDEEPYPDYLPSDDKYEHYTVTVKDKSASATAVRVEQSTTAKSDVVSTTMTDVVTEPTTVPKQTKEPTADYSVPEWASSDLKTAAKALNTAKGREILEYEYLVREEAFYSTFHYVFDVNVPGLNTSLSIDLPSFFFDEDEAASGLYDSYYRAVEATFDSNFFDIEYSEIQLSSLALNYYVLLPDGTVYTNLSDPMISKIPASLGGTGEEFGPDVAFIGISDGKLLTNGLDRFRNGNYLYWLGTLEGILRGSIEPADNLTAVFFTSTEPDAAKVFYDGITRKDTVERDILLCVLFFLAALALLIVMLVFCGSRDDEGKIRLNFFDRLPTDIVFILSWAVIIALDCLAVGAFLLFIFGNGYSFSASPASFFNSLRFSPVSKYVCFTALLLGWLVFAGWLASVVRIKKSGRSWFRCLALIMALSWIFRKIGNVAKKLFNVLRYKPGKFSFNVLIIAFLWFVADAILALIIIGLACGGMEGGAIALTLFTLALNAFGVWMVLDYIRKLDTVIRAASERSKITESTDKYPVSLKTLSDSVALTRADLDRAVESAVRDERMKTELITNVSHDLKTPLTSIITYVDLLRRCEIEDETARGYLDILDEKSKRLKSLVEDLVEASKASSGAVTLNLVPINLRELAMQALGEMDDDFSSAELETVFSCTDDAPVVLADSQKTFRIIENLLTNARKYSAPYSRVYIKVFKGIDCGLFEVKNISKEPLNIPSAELMERFVRGDEARTDGGNGLGLSIAKDLSTLQGGDLVIDIDGDLFKARLLLPLFREPDSGDTPEEEPDEDSLPSPDAPPEPEESSEEQ